MASKKQTALSSLCAPREVGLNRDTNLLKLVAMITMLIDHAGKIFFPQYRLMRIIGRIAFPIYAYCISVGGVYSSNRLRYLSRILLMGLISQPVYAVALQHTTPAMYTVRFSQAPLKAIVNFYVHSWSTPNIMYTLALGLLVIWSIRDRQFICTLALALYVWKAQNTINYGWKGVALIVLFYLFISRWWISLPVLLAYMTWWGLNGSGYSLFGARFGIQMYALMALPLIYIPTFSNLKINKWVYYLYYPGHLIGIMLVKYAMSFAK